MWIGLEGVDGSGKSTLAKNIADTLEGAQSLHRSQPKRDTLEEYALDVEAYRPNAWSEHIVADRWHYGELIYGPLYRQTEPDWARFRWTELFLASRGAVFYVVTNPMDVIEKRLADRGEDFLQSHHVEHVDTEFRSITKDSILNYGIVEPDGDTTNLVEAIVAQGELRGSLAAPLAPYPEYIGPPTPSVLLVGDKRGGKKPHPTQAPFMPTSTSSGRFLLESLDDSIWRSIGIVNASETDLVALWETLAGPEVVTLGNEADVETTRQGVPHRSAPHPQWVRRFKSDKKIEYGMMIRDLARGVKGDYEWLS